MKAPPRWADKFLEWYCNRDLLEDLQGDLHERFNDRVRRRGRFIARILFVVDVLLFFRPYTFRRPNRKQKSVLMIKHFYQMSVRMLLRRKLYSLINISGLVMGMTAFLMIGVYVLHEQSYDSFHAKRDQIFRLKLNWFSDGVLNLEAAGVGAAVGPDLHSIFPEINRYVRLRQNQVMLSYKEKVFRERGVYFASEDFFTMFSIPLIRGIDSMALREPWKVALSESFAKKYFGDEDPIGKILTNTGSEKYEVTAIFTDIPENSHLKIDAVFSFASLELIFGKEKDPYLTDWGWIGYPTYIELDPLVDPHAFESKLKAEVERRTQNSMSFELQPVQSIHLNSHFEHEIGPNGDKRIVDIISLVAILILAMAWVNYISLTTARSLERAKEVGIRKVLGSSRVGLIAQFLSESFLYNATALIVTLALVKILLPAFGSMVGRDFASMELLNIDNITFVALLFLSGVLCSGVYPALVLSSHATGHALKGPSQSSISMGVLRRALVVMQFATAVVLICGSLVIKLQLKHLQNSPVGVDMEQVLVVEGPIVSDSLYQARFNWLKDEMMSYPGIRSVSASSAVPGRDPRSGSNGVQLQGQSPKDGHAFDVFYIDTEFIETFGLTITAGRTFSPDFNDEKSVIVNESGMRILGIVDAKKIIGEKILVYGEPMTVVGVLKDYYFKSVREQIGPALYLHQAGVRDFYSFSVNSKESMSALIGLVESKYKEQFPGNEFVFFFLDDLYNGQYQSEQRFGKAFDVFTLAGIFIACFGLYGLSSYLILLRSKEIAIRKVLGASIRQIAFMVSREFVLTVLIGNVIAWPFAWWLMNGWLSNYASRINLDLIFLLIPTVLVLLIAIFTVALQVIRAAKANPAVVIREN
jgi:putative ABC transport system permease protein